MQDDERLDVIRRVLNGERQSDLAREYQVTRAAICNTFKNRRDILRRSQQPPAAAAGAAVAPPNSRQTPMGSMANARPPRDSIVCAAGSGCCPPAIGSGRGIVSESSSSSSGGSFPSRDSSSSGGSSSSGESLTSSNVMANTLPTFASLQTESLRLQRCASPVVVNVREMRTLGMYQLLTQLRDRQTPPHVFKNVGDRVIRLLLEEALGMGPVVPVAVMTPQRHGWQGVKSVADYVAVGIGNGGYPFLKGFRELIPEGQTGSIAFGSRDVQRQASALSYSLPPIVRQSNVLLVDCECVTGESAYQAIEILLNEGIPEQAIYLTCVLASREGIHNVLTAFPGVHILTAAVDPDINRDLHPSIRPGCGGFLDRYYDTDVLYGRLI